MARTAGFDALAQDDPVLRDGITVVGSYDVIGHPRRCDCPECKRYRADWALLTGKPISKESPTRTRGKGQF